MAVGFFRAVLGKVKVEFKKNLFLQIKFVVLLDKVNVFWYYIYQRNVFLNWRLL